jgi:hypothetical protein
MDRKKAPDKPPLSLQGLPGQASPVSLILNERHAHGIFHTAPPEGRKIAP